MPKKEVKQIVLIHSFEEERENYAFFNKELIKELNKQGIKATIHTFYLNCDFFSSKEESRRMYNYIDSIRHINPDIILVNDDQATYMLLACKHPFVKEIPIVFAGVNYPNWELIKEYRNITGWHDKQDFVKNIKFIHTLFGRLTIRIAYDRTALGKQSFIEVLKQIRPNKNITIVRPTKHLFDSKKASVNDSTSFQILIDTTLNDPDFRIASQQKDWGQVLFSPIRLLSGSSILNSLSGQETHTIYLDTKYDYLSEAMPTLVTYPSISAHNEPIQYSPHHQKPVYRRISDLA